MSPLLVHLLSDRLQAIEKKDFYSAPGWVKDDSMSKSDEKIFNIGDDVYSPKFGVGKVLKVDFIESANTHFYVVESHNNQSKLMVPVKSSTKQMRTALSHGKAKEMLKLLSSPADLEDFETKRDRVQFFKAQQQNVRIKERIQAFAYLHHLADKGKVEKEIYQQMLQDFSSEFSFAMKTTADAACQEIMSQLSGAA